MPDWKAILRERLILKDLSPRQQDETIAELAAHLDDLCGQYREQGKNESAAISHVIGEVRDWQALSQTIQRAKREEEPMNTRTKHLWLPGLINLAAAMLVLTFEVRLDLHPRMYAANSVTMVFYLPWLLSLPFCGALGAYFSRRAGGDLWTRLATASFPASAYLGCFALVFLVTRFGPDHSASLGAIAIVIATWALIPGAALLLGALPFLRTSTVGERKPIS